MWILRRLRCAVAKATTVRARHVCKCCVHQVRIKTNWVYAWVRTISVLNASFFRLVIRMRGARIEYWALVLVEDIPHNRMSRWGRSWLTLNERIRHSTTEYCCFQMRPCTLRTPIDYCAFNAGNEYDLKCFAGPLCIHSLNEPIQTENWSLIYWRGALWCVALPRPPFTKSWNENFVVVVVFLRWPTNLSTRRSDHRRLYVYIYVIICRPIM